MDAGLAARTLSGDAMEYTLETARRLAEELRAIPAKDPSQRRLDKQAMVRELAQELIALQQRGYTVEEVAESLRGRGFEITTPTLRNYLQRAKNAGAKGRKPRRPPGRPGGRAEVGPAAEPKPPAARAPAESSPKPAATTAKAESPALPGAEPPLRGGKSAFLIKDKESY
jgi:hypothetical protein